MDCGMGCGCGCQSEFGSDREGLQRSGSGSRRGKSRRRCRFYPWIWTQRGSFAAQSQGLTRHYHQVYVQYLLQQEEVEEKEE